MHTHDENGCCHDHTHEGLPQDVHEHAHEHPHTHTHEHTHEHAHEHTHADGTTHCHVHEHDHPHEHTGEHGPHDHSHDGSVSAQTMALLGYMLNHNRDHAAEIHGLAHKLEEEGRADEARLIHEGVSLYNQGNDLLEQALAALEGKGS